MPMNESSQTESTAGSATAADQQATADTTDAAPVRVLHVRTMAGRGGGPEKTILRSPRHVDPQRYAMWAAYLHPSRDRGIEALRSDALALGCPLFSLPERCAVDPRPLWRLLGLCRRQRVNIWHGHDYKSNLYGLMLRRWHPMRVMSTEHGWGVRGRRLALYFAIERWTLRQCDHVICVSAALGDACGAMGIGPDRLSLVHNAIDLREWKRIANPARARQELQLDPRTPTIGVVGRFSHEKGVDRMIDAIPALNRRLGPVQVLLIGDGPLRGRLQEQARQLGVADQVRFAGWCKPLQSWYEAMDLLVLPSRSEGLANVLLEAMAMGVPVAATDVGDTRMLLDDGRCGAMLGGDVRDWPEPMAGLLTHHWQTQRMVAAAHQRIAEHFSFDARMTRVTAIYDRLVGTERTTIGDRSPIRGQAA